MQEDHSISVSRFGDIVVARRTAKQFAQQLGFDSTEQEQIALVTSELASNLVKYAEHGYIHLKAIQATDKSGIQISSHDHGPGFDSLQALTDGYSSSGSLGIGLGAIRRMVDAIDIDSRQSGHSGSDIICKKWLSSPGLENKRPLSSLDIGVISYPKQGLDVNGDAYMIHDTPDGQCLIAVIDGVGHGPHAHTAAQTARHYIENHSEQPLADIFRGVESACQATSGVVMAIAHFNANRSLLTFASIGNIESKIVGSREKKNLLIKRGIIGRQAPAPIVSQYLWTQELGIIMHSDGVSPRWNWQDFPHFPGKPAQFVAEQMFHKLHRVSDDATLIYAK